jgi:UDP-N-acetyl-2-amino-2-deoxyglucuronate dehydrogenase
MHLKFALIGCGRIAERHAEQMRKWGQIAAVCDIIPERMEAYARQDGSNTYISIDHLFAHELNLDLVVICSPNYLHAAHSIMALNHGFHVLCEKPLSISTKDAKNMIQAANENKKSLFVVKQNRYNPPVMALKHLITSGKLGKINSFQINCFWNRPDAYYKDSWRGNREMDGGILYTQFSHFIDLLMWMLGDVKSTHALTANYLHPQIEIEDAGVICFEMQSGAMGTMHFHVNAYRQNMEGSFTIFAENGTIKVGGKYLNTIEYQTLEGETIHTEASTATANDYGFYQGSMSNHHLVYADVVKTLCGEDRGVADGHEGLKSVEIIEQIYRSAKRIQS